MTVCLSVQSLVAAGHVGHGASAFALAAEGVEVWPVPTVVLSGHAATPGVQGRRLPGAEVAALAQGLEAAGALARCDGLLTGYLGTADAAEATADLAAAVKAARPDAVFLCDPVLGDEGAGLYLPEAVGEVYRARLLPMADIAAPNVFELGWLTGLPTTSRAEMLEAAQALRALGPESVHVTSAGEGSRIGILTVTARGAWMAEAPRLPLHLHGAGDFAAALLMAGALAGEAPQDAAARAVGAAHALAAEARRMGREDLPVIAARTLWAAARDAPSTRIA